MSFTLDDIEACIREVTATPSTDEMSQAYVYDKINKFYLYVLPNDFKPFNLNVTYTFNTLQNQVNYTFDLTTYQAFEPEVFLNGNQLLYYQDRSLWIRDNQYQYNQSTVSEGDGITLSFSGTISTPPNIIPGTARYTDGVENFTDDGLGVFVGSLGGSGTINYSTGAWSITFATAPLAGASIIQTYAPLNNGRPRSIYYDGAGNIQFSPIPDQTYIVQCTALILPTAFISGSQSPVVAQWGYTIAYGTALEIFRRRGQKDQVAVYQQDYEKYLDLSLSQATEQSSNQRTIPKW